MGNGAVLDIPIAGGLQENTDPRLVQTGLLRATNVRYARRDGLVPRFGTAYGPRPTAVVFGGGALPTPDGLFTLGDQLVYTGCGQLLSYTPAANSTTSTGIWSPVGAVPQFVVDRTGVTASMHRQRDASSATMQSNFGRLVMTVWSERVNDVISTVYAVYASLADEATGAILIPAFLVDVTVDQYCLPKVACAELTFGSFLVTWSEPTNTAIRARSFSAVTMTWSNTSTLVGSVRTLPNQTAYAMCARGTASGGTDFLLVYQSSVGVSQRQFLVINAAGASPSVVANITITDTDTNTTTCFGIDGTNVGEVWVVYGRYDPGATNGQKVRVAIIDDTTLLAPFLALGPITVYTGTTGGAADAEIQVYNASVKRLGGGLCLAAWSLNDSAAGVGITPRVAVATVDSNGGVVAGETYRAGIVLTSDLFLATFADGTKHAMFAAGPWAELASAAVGVIPPLGNAYLLEATLADTSLSIPANRFPEHAVYAIGQTEAVEGPFFMPDCPRAQSSLAAVYPTAAGNFAWVGFDRQRGDASARIHRMTATQTWSRSAAELGGRLLISGGVPTLFDGATTTEWGDLSIPQVKSVTKIAAGGLTGTFLYTYVAEWADSTGAIQHSIPAPPFSVTLANEAARLRVRTIPVTTRRSSAYVPREWIGLVIYRTTVGSSGPFYRSTPLIVPFENANSTSLLTKSLKDDNTTDFALALNPQLYVTGGALDAQTPPSARHARVWQGRFVLAGTDDDSIWYSTEFVDGETPRFNEGLRLQPFAGGRVTALGVLGDALVVFKRDSIYIVSGSPPNDTGDPASSSLSAPTQIVADMGAIDAGSVVLMPLGLMFRSRRGIYLIDRGLSVTFIGEGVGESTLPSAVTITASVLVPEQNQVRFSLDAPSAGAALVYDYLTQAWTRYEWRDTFNATAAARESDAEAWDLYGFGVQVLTVSIDGGATQTITFNNGNFVNPLLATAAEVAAVILAQIVGATALVTSGNKVTIRSNALGPASGVNVTGGLANDVLGFPVGNVAGTGLAAQAPRYAVVHDGRYAFVWADGQLGLEDKTSYRDGLYFVPVDVQTPWVRTSGLQARQQARRWSVLGEYGGPHTVRVTGYTDYGDAADVPGTFALTAAPAAGYQFAHPTRAPNEGQSVSLRIATSGDVAPDQFTNRGRPMSLSGVCLEYDKITNAQQRQLPPAQIG